jgi:clan AA aspartic protease
VIIGLVTPNREPIVELRVRGPQNTELVVKTILDTGFTAYLSLPPSLIAALGLPYRGTDTLMLADGSLVSSDYYEAIVVWDGRERKVSVHSLGGSALLGMSLLWGHLLTMRIVSGGRATISSIP